MVLFALLGIATVLIFMATKNSASSAPNVPPTESQVAQAIGQLAALLTLPQSAVDILVAQSDLETGHWASSSFLNTNSLFNRHKGDGIAGSPDSDGYWTGNTYYAGPGDSDLRIYTDIFQSARDMAQLLGESLYQAALAALKNGDAAGYYAALGAVGFSTDPSYASNLLNLYGANYA